MEYRNATPEEIQAIKAEHDTVYAIDLRNVVSLEGEPQVIYRAMREADRKRLSALAKNEDPNADAQIAQRLVVYPEPEVWREMCSTAYYVNTLVVKDAVEKYGLVQVETGKKL